MNDTERKQWVMNDEGLYDLYRRNTSLNLDPWVIANRSLIDEVIANVTSGTKPAHYLKYGLGRYSNQ